MADYAGALKAIEARLVERWAERTPIATMNDARPKVVDQKGDLIPWLFLEIAGTGSSLVGAGRPGDHRYVYRGLIYIHVFVPTGSKTSDAMRLAVDAGEIFRTAEFYRDTPGCCVRSWSPRVDGGGSGADDGLWWRVTAAIPFEYLHRG